MVLDIFHVPWPDLIFTFLHPDFGPWSLICIDSSDMFHLLLAFSWVWPKGAPIGDVSATI